MDHPVSHHSGRNLLEWWKLKTGRNTRLNLRTKNMVLALIIGAVAVVLYVYAIYHVMGSMAKS